MEFSYTAYRSVCLSFPLFAICLFSPGLVAIFVSYIKSIIKKCKVNREKFFKDIFILGIALYFLSTSVGYLAHGGIYLIGEKEEAAIALQGEISDMEELADFSFPRVKTQYEYEGYHGVQFTVNGVECAAPIKGSLEVGDTVEVLYLPKSGYVLSIQEIEPSIEP